MTLNVDKSPLAVPEMSMKANRSAVHPLSEDRLYKRFIAVASVEDNHADKNDDIQIEEEWSNKKTSVRDQELVSGERRFVVRLPNPSEIEITTAGLSFFVLLIQRDLRCVAMRYSDSLRRCLFESVLLAGRQAPPPEGRPGPARLGCVRRNPHPLAVPPRTIQPLLVSHPGRPRGLVRGPEPRAQRRPHAPPGKRIECERGITRGDPSLAAHGKEARTPGGGRMRAV